MREIKFRAWDKIQKKMIPEWFSIHKNHEPLEFMQFTGLKDKNGKEIYEGDVVKGDYRVIWKQKFASFGLVHPSWLFVHYFGEAADPEECEVIGNIYESPELLK